MAGLLERALAARIGEPEPAERLLVGGRFVTVPGARSPRPSPDAGRQSCSYFERRRMLRERSAELIRARGGDAAAAADALDNLVERLWPQQTAAAFLRDLLGSRRRLAAAAGDAFTPEEVAAAAPARRRPGV